MSSLHVLVAVAGEQYALPVENVLEVAEYGTVAPVPGAPVSVLGVCNLRGNVLAVLDAGVVFAIECTEKPRRIAIVEHDGCRAGLAVDGVIGVDHLPEATEEVESHHLMGACLHDGALVGVVDVPSVLESVRTAA